MVIVQVYFALAFCIALLTWVGYFLPILREARAKGVCNALTESPITASIVFIVITTVLAPFVVSVLILPLHSEHFRLGLQRIIEENE